MRGFKTCGAGPVWGDAERRLVQCRSFSSPRVSVARLSRGGRMPMVLTQLTRQRPTSWRMRCWQLEGCLPQSSAETSKDPTAGSTTQHFLVQMMIMSVHLALREVAIRPFAAKLSHLLGHRRVLRQAENAIGEQGIIASGGEQAGNAILHDLRHTADLRG